MRIKNLEQIYDDIKIGIEIPILENNLVNLLNSINSGEKDLLKLAKIIYKDHGLAFKTLKLANSSYYNPGKVPISTITKAISFLGLERLKKELLQSRVKSNKVLKANDLLNLKNKLFQTYFSAFVASAFTKKFKKEELLILSLIKDISSVWLLLNEPEVYKALQGLKEKNPVRYEFIINKLERLLISAHALPEMLKSTEAEEIQKMIVDIRENLKDSYKLKKILIEKYQIKDIALIEKTIENAFKLSKSFLESKDQIQKTKKQTIKENTKEIKKKELQYSKIKKEHKIKELKSDQLLNLINKLLNLVQNPNIEIRSLLKEMSDIYDPEIVLLIRKNGYKFKINDYFTDKGLIKLSQVLKFEKPFMLKSSFMKLLKLRSIFSGSIEQLDIKFLNQLLKNEKFLFCPVNENSFVLVIKNEPFSVKEEKLAILFSNIINLKLKLNEKAESKIKRVSTYRI